MNSKRSYLSYILQATDGSNIFLLSRFEGIVGSFEKDELLQIASNNLKLNLTTHRNEFTLRFKAHKLKRSQLKLTQNQQQSCALHTVSYFSLKLQTECECWEMEECRFCRCCLCCSFFLLLSLLFSLMHILLLLFSMLLLLLFLLLLLLFVVVVVVVVCCCCLLLLLLLLVVVFHHCTVYSACFLNESTCFNGGTCHGVGAGYSCQCTPDHTGRLCEVGKLW